MTSVIFRYIQLAVLDGVKGGNYLFAIRCI